MFRLRVLMIALAILVCQVSFAEVLITVEDGEDWKGLEKRDLKALSENIVSHFQETLRPENKVDGIKIVIRQDQDGPWVRWWPNMPDSFLILIWSNDGFLGGYIWEFAHEFCHIMHNYEDAPNEYVNTWFQESLCMMSSIWMLKKMSDVWWDGRPPWKKGGWVRGEWADYADWVVELPEYTYGGTSSEWLDEHENFLRGGDNEDFVHHDLTAQLSFKYFLPIFEKYPEAWNAVRKLPISNRKMDGYMHDWYESVDPQDQGFVEDIAFSLGFLVGARSLPFQHGAGVWAALKRSR